METRPTVLVSAPQYDKARLHFEAAQDLCFLRAPGDEDGLADALLASGASMVIVGGLPYRQRLYEVLERNGHGRALVARYGVGHDNVDKEQCRQRGITVTNTPGVLQTAVAELTLALMAGLARQVATFDREMRAGRFDPRTSMHLRGKRLAVIGFGAIGRCVAQGAHAGYGMRVMAAGRRTAAELERQEGVTIASVLGRYGAESYTADVDALLETADVVSLHMPPPPEPRTFLDRPRLSRLRPGALLINTARGSLVDEIALYDALHEGRLAGAALDVFAQEPYVPAGPDKDLRTLPNVICTPHVGSNTLEANQAIAEACARNVRAFLAGRTEELNRVSC